MHSSTDQWDWSVLGPLALREAGLVLTAHHDAEDAAQDALVRAWRARHRCTGVPAAYVKAIARNEALRLATRRSPTPHDDPFAACPAAAVEAPADDVVHMRLEVSRALDRLPPYDRLLVTLYYGLDESAARVANRLEMKEATVRVRLFRARKTLRAILEEWGDATA